MRSAQERIGFLEKLATVRQDAAAGVEAVRSSSREAAKTVGVLGACTAGAALCVRLAKGAFFSRSRSGAVAAVVSGGWKLALTKQVLTLLVLPLAKEYVLPLTKAYVINRLTRPAALPAAEPKPTASASAPAPEPYRISGSPSFFSRFSLNRILSRLVGL